MQKSHERQVTQSGGTDVVNLLPESISTLHKTGGTVPNYVLFKTNSSIDRSKWELVDVGKTLDAIHNKTAPSPAVMEKRNRSKAKFKRELDDQRNRTIVDAIFDGFRKLIHAFPK